jgi:hypothetical protein
MEKEGFKVSRISDELFLIKEQYATAREARISGKPYDLSQIDSRITSLSATIDLAYLTRDEIIAVKIEAENTKKEIDVNEAELIIKQAEQEFNDQRYEKAREYVNSAYEKLIELKSFQAKANAAYIAARKNIEGFLIENGQIIVGILLAIAVLYLLFRKKIKRALLKKKIKDNEAEVMVLKKEIQKAQESFFVRNNLSEGEYAIKTKIYGEKIRDLNRDNALLTEQLEGTKGKKKEWKEHWTKL